jgi:hypothetical protein
MLARDCPALPGCPAREASEPAERYVRALRARGYQLAAAFKSIGVGEFVIETIGDAGGFRVTMNPVAQDRLVAGL